MDNDRKYRQHGYMDSDRDRQPFREDRSKPQGPRPPIDVTGPRLPRLVQHVAASRCFNCSTALPAEVDFGGTCPKCNADLHCCKQCTHFEPSTRFQCMKPIPVRIAVKDKTNTCTLFGPRRPPSRRIWLAGRRRRATRTMRATRLTGYSRRRRSAYLLAE